MRLATNIIPSVIYTPVFVPVGPHRLSRKTPWKQNEEEAQRFLHRLFILKPLLFIFVHFLFLSEQSELKATLEQERSQISNLRQRDLFAGVSADVKACSVGF